MEAGAPGQIWTQTAPAIQAAETAANLDSDFATILNRKTADSSVSSQEMPTQLPITQLALSGKKKLFLANA